MAKRMKEKAAAVQERREKRPFATAKYVRISPDKVRIVLALIRGYIASYAQSGERADFQGIEFGCGKCRA